MLPMDSSAVLTAVARLAAEAATLTDLVPRLAAVVREAMKGARQLLRVDPKPPPDSLERDLRGRVLSEELEDVAVVLPQVEALDHGRLRLAGDHRGSHCGGSSNTCVRERQCPRFGPP